MAFLNTTRWRDNEVGEDENLDDIVLSIHRNIPSYNDETLNEYLNINSEIAFDENQSISINNTLIEYNVINFNMDVRTPIDSNEYGDESISVETNNARYKSSEISAFIVIYKDETGQFFYIISRPVGEARKMLRKFRSYTNRGEITEEETNVNSDFFLWLVYKVFNQNNSFELRITDENIKTLDVNTITGIRGVTHDQHSVRADGNRVINLISTLAFLIESEIINRVLLKCNYDDVHDKIEIRLEDKKISVDIDKYVGEFRESSLANFDYNRTLAQVLLLVYLEIVPNLETVYLSERSSDWTADTINEFKIQIKEDLISRLE